MPAASKITNYLSPLEFELTITRLPNVSFFLQRAAIPGIAASPVPQPSPFNPTFHTPDKLTFDELQITFIVDEKMRNWLEIFNWMNGMAKPRSFGEFKELNESPEGLYSDITLLIKNSNKNPNIQVDFVNAFPLNLSDIQLDTTQTDIVYPEATVSFRYDTFSVTVKD